MVHQGSFLGPFFSVFTPMIFFFGFTVINLHDDISFFVGDKHIGSLINRLGFNFFLAIEWFLNNYMKLSRNKCHLLVAGQK